jgi:large subunit ribosomal protein L25
VAQVAIKAESRSDFGKGAARRTRRAGLVPAVIYGKGEEPRHVALPDHDLTLALRHPGLVLEVELDGSKVLVAPRDVQRDPVKRVIEHVDLVLLSKSEAADRIEEGKAAEAALEAAHAAEAEALKYATEADDLDTEAHLDTEPGSAAAASDDADEAEADAEA